MFLKCTCWRISTSVPLLLQSIFSRCCMLLQLFTNSGNYLLLLSKFSLKFVPGKNRTTYPSVVTKCILEHKSGGNQTSF